MKKIFLTLSALIFAGTLLGCSGLKKIIEQPEIAFESFSMGEAKGDSITLIPSVKVTNNNGFDIPLDDLKYNLKVNDRNLFSGNTKVEGMLKSKKAKIIDIPVTLTKETLDFFVNSLTKDKQVKYFVDGGASVAGFTIPFDKEGTIFFPEVKVGELSVNDASMSSIDMNVDLSILNKNDFALPFKGISYDVTSGAKSLFNSNIVQNGIKQNDSTKINIPIKINPSNVISSTLELISKPNVDIGFNAVADLGFTKIPFSKEETINLKEHILGK